MLENISDTVPHGVWIMLEGPMGALAHGWGSCDSFAGTGEAMRMASMKTSLNRNTHTTVAFGSGST